MEPRATWRAVSEIAAQLGHVPSDDLPERIATHIRMFWEPRLRLRLREEVKAGLHGGDPVVARVVAALDDG